MRDHLNASLSRAAAAFSTSVWVLAILAATAGAAPAQNLVPNPSFESYTTCPGTIGQLGYCVGWTAPNGSTPDYHNACAAPGVVSVPSNAWGNQAARTGKGYVSSIVWFKKPFPVEYIEAKLTSPLVGGKSYDVSFWVSLTDKACHAISDLGAYLSNGSVAGPGLFYSYVPQIQNPLTNLLTDKANWVQISGTFVAAGGEDHIVIGCFKSITATTKTTVPGALSPYANYYIDDVSVTATAPSGGVVATPHLVGWSDALPGAGYIDLQDVDGGCKPAETRCRTSAVPKASVFYAGGTAYDARIQTVWVSDGVRLAEYYLQPSPGRSCRPRCKLIGAVTANQRARVSGLAHAERKAQLYQLATAPGYAEVTTYDTTACPGKPTICRIVLPNGALAGGLAYDEASDRLFIAVSTPRKAGGWSTALWLATGAKPCSIVCRTKLFTCNANFVTGLAFDSCQRRLYATDGQITQTFEESSRLRCIYKAGDCCKKQLSPVYRGLAVVPGWTKKTFGHSCTRQPCASCPTMKVVHQGDPSLGSIFQIGLQDAPVGGAAILFGKVGGCGPKFVLPRPFCGIFWAVPIQFMFAPVNLTGLAQCDGRARWALPIPTDRNLCGLKLCLQWYVTCRTAAGFGTGLSEGFEFSITGG